MARRKKLSERKKEIISYLINEYEIESAKDIHDAIKDLLGDTIESMLEAEMEHHLGYETNQRSNNENSRNGYKTKRIRSSMGESEISVPQDRDSSFEPQIVKKRQKDISEIENKVIGMYSIGLSTRQISEQIYDIYGFGVSDGLVSDITDKILPEIEDWQKRPLSETYPVVFIDAIHFSVKEEGLISKKAAYIILGINEDGLKEVLGIYVGQNESSKYWLGVLNSLKNRGVKDIFIICSDGLTGIEESISAAYPKAEWQTCIVHMVRNTLKYVSYKDRKQFANDLKTIYHAPDEEVASKNRLKVAEAWDKKYPGSMDRWEREWNSITPIFKYSKEVRKIVYTTNAIESLNSSYRRLNRNRSVFPSATSLMKALYLATNIIAKKWNIPLRNWGSIVGELRIMHDLKN